MKPCMRAHRTLLADVRHATAQKGRAGSATMTPAAALSHSSAVCLIPDRSTWEQLQDIRCFQDKAFVRWPPHINLLYPWLPDDGINFAEGARLAAAQLARVSSFKVTPV